MRSNPKPQEMYRHRKGDIYQIRCLAKHGETGEMMVVYQAMHGAFQIYVISLSMFMKEIDTAVYSDAGQQYEFELISDIELASESQLMSTSEPIAEEKIQEEDEQLNIDPRVMEFLEADTYEQRLNILSALRHRITDDMINMMALAVDLEIKEGDVEERYEEFKNCLLTFERYECNRLR